MCKKDTTEGTATHGSDDDSPSPSSPITNDDGNKASSKAKAQKDDTTAGKHGTSSSALLIRRRHRGKREPYSQYAKEELGWTLQMNPAQEVKSQFVRQKPKKQSKAKQKHGADAPSGGIESLAPSLIGLAILGCGLMAKLGFRGRAQVAGIDLGTTNSVVCVQQPSKGVGHIECMVDPLTNSSIIPSVVSFLEPSERPVGAKSKTPSLLVPHPSQVVVGQAAKKRIDTHPHHTLYNAKRILGRPPTDRAIQELQEEVEFQIATMHGDDDNDDENVIKGEPLQPDQRVVFKVPHHSHANQPTEWRNIAPQQVGSYIVHALLQLTYAQLGHDNVKAAVICVPAKFDTVQRQRTVAAFEQAGVKVTRILEEPTAAALAYGLHQKQGVDYIVVYDFGGGTLDVSLLHVSDGFVDVMGSDGDDRLGGADFDAAIARLWLSSDDKSAMVSNVSAALKQLDQWLEGTPQHLDLEQELSIHCPAILEHPLCTVSSFHTMGEQLKIQLSNTFQNGSDQNENLETQCLRLPQGMDSIPPHDEPLYMVDYFCKSLSKTTLMLTRSEFQQVSEPLFERSILPVQRLLKDLNLKTDEIDEVVMVGGTTRMPQIRELVRQALPDSQLNTYIDPDITVAYGAASVID